VSPAGAINVISHCWAACLELLQKGLMCRGYIKRGLIYHTEKDVYGPGHVEVVEKEKQVSFFKGDSDKSGTPFFEVDQNVVDYVAIKRENTMAAKSSSNPRNPPTKPSSLQAKEKARSGPSLARFGSTTTARGSMSS